MKANMFFSLIVLSGFASNAFAQESLAIEGRFVNHPGCNSIAPVNAVIGRANGQAITICAEDVFTLKPSDFTNGATMSALNDGQTYTIIGTLHEGTFSVDEVARVSE